MTDTSLDLDTWAGFRDRLYAQGEFDIDFGLDAFREALERWNNPQRSHPVVLVGGTNGKGGIASGIDAVLGAHGLTTGLFTSPHLLSVRERFRVDGRPVSRESLKHVGVEALRTFGSPSGDAPQLSFFELCCVMAVSLFEREDVDVGIYEVGLGGRLDATNTLEPAVSVLGSIGMDHQRFLGETIEDVVTEKTGILRSGSPAVVGPQRSSEIVELIRESAPTGADFRMVGSTEKWLDGIQDVLDELSTFQQDNLRTAVAAVEAFFDERGDATGILLDSELVARGLRDHRWPGRFEWRRVEPTADGTLEVDAGPGVHLLVDAAHNPQAIETLVEEMRRTEVSPDGALVGFMAEKAAGEMVSALRDAFGGDVPIVGAEIGLERALDGRGLVKAGCDGTAPMPSALDEVIRQITSVKGDGEPLVLVTGSIYLLGELYRALGVTADELTTRQSSR